VTTQATATFTVESWDEVPWDEQADLPKLTRATVEKALSGDLEGTSTTVWLMSYGADGSADFVGIERVKGTVGGRAGSFVLQHIGRYDEGAARASLGVIPGSGTGDLSGISGEGSFVADPNGSIALELSFAGSEG
jgi:hypothetical protein